MPDLAASQQNSHRPGIAASIKFPLVRRRALALPSLSHHARDSHGIGVRGAGGSSPMTSEKLAVSSAIPRFFN